MFDAVLIEKSDSGQEAGLSKIDTSRLPQGEVLVDVAWSTLNYKDALAITGASPVVRSLPMVPGIDFAGVVAESSHSAIEPGDRVVLNGWGGSGIGVDSRQGACEWRLAGAGKGQPPGRHGGPLATRRCCAPWRSSATV